MAKRGIVVAGASDLHGDLGHTFPKCHIACLVGDLVPLYSTAEDWRSHQEADWVETKFVRYVGRIFRDTGCEFVIITFGNHDICFYDPATRDRVYGALKNAFGDKVIILDDRNPTAEVLGIHVAGFPYTPTIQSRRWAYNLPRYEAERWANVLEYSIPDETELLLTHGPPLGILDSLHWGDGKDHIGSADLLKRVVDVCPEVILTGHCHAARGKRAKFHGIGGDTIKAVNVSLCDTGYSVKGAKIQTIEM